MVIYPDSHYSSCNQVAITVTIWFENMQINLHNDTMWWKQMAFVLGEACDGMKLS